MIILQQKIENIFDLSSNLEKMEIAGLKSNLGKKAIAVLGEIFYDGKIQVITTNKLMAIAQSLNSIRYRFGLTSSYAVTIEAYTSYKVINPHGNHHSQRY